MAKCKENFKLKHIIMFLKKIRRIRKRFILTDKIILAQANHLKQKSKIF